MVDRATVHRTWLQLGPIVLGLCPARNSCPFLGEKWLMNKSTPILKIAAAHEGVGDASADECMERRGPVQLEAGRLVAASEDGRVDGSLEAFALQVADRCHWR